MKEEKIRYSQIHIDELAEEAIKAGHTGRGVDGYISDAIEQRGQRAIGTITEQTPKKTTPSKN